MMVEWLRDNVKPLEDDVVAEAKKRWGGQPNHGKVALLEAGMKVAPLEADGIPAPCTVQQAQQAYIMGQRSLDWLEARLPELIEKEDHELLQRTMRANQARERREFIFNLPQDGPHKRRWPAVITDFAMSGSGPVWFTVVWLVCLLSVVALMLLL